MVARERGKKVLLLVVGSWSPPSAQPHCNLQLADGAPELFHGELPGRRIRRPADGVLVAVYRL